MLEVKAQNDNSQHCIIWTMRNRCIIVGQWKIRHLANNRWLANRSKWSTYWRRKKFFCFFFWFDSIYKGITTVSQRFMSWIISFDHVCWYIMFVKRLMLWFLKKRKKKTRKAIQNADEIPKNNSNMASPLYVFTSMLYHIVAGIKSQCGECCCLTFNFEK